MSYKKNIILVVMIIFCLLISGCGRKDIVLNDTELPSEDIKHQGIIKENDSSDYQVDNDNSDIFISENETTESFNPRKDITIAIDPGHQAPSVDMSATEPNGPGSSVMKAKATGGTTGKFTGVGEYELNLTIAKKLKNKLSTLGYEIIMTREDNETAISNMERAQLANNMHANVSIRIHANGSEDSSTNGALVLVGSQNNPYVGQLYDDSYKFGEMVLEEYCNNTGMKNLGVQTNDTMTGINWSEIPVIILEMGFMSNEIDDKNMQDNAYQEKMVEGIVNGVEKYFCMKNETMTIEDNDISLQMILDETTASFSNQSNGNVEVCVVDLISGDVYETGNTRMVAASLIKLYIAGCIYELNENNGITISSDEEELVHRMISESDNDATNILIKKLGDGDVEAGMVMVNDYCKRNGFTDSNIGRLMLDYTSGKENYTSVRDTTEFLRLVYNKKISGSDKILMYLKQQERKTKIPAGIPEGVVTANKTGELENVENDVAIVYADKHPYIIGIMTNNLDDSSAGRTWIVETSKKVYDFFTTPNLKE